MGFEIEMLDTQQDEVAAAATAAPANGGTAEGIGEKSLALVRGTLKEFDGVEAGLAGLRIKYANVVYPVGTTAGMAEAKAARLEIRGPRYAVDKVLKATKEPLNAIKKELDDRASQITAALMEIETPIHEQIKTEEDRKAAEKAERERVAAAQKLVVDTAIAWIRNHAIQAVGKSSADISEMVLSLEKLDVTLETYRDRSGEAEQCRIMTLGILTGLHAAVSAQEAAAAKIEADRIQMENDRAEQARIANEAAATAAAARAAEEAAAKVKHAAEAAELQRQRDAFEDEQAAARAAQQAEATRLQAQADELARQRAELEPKPEVPSVNGSSSAINNDASAELAAAQANPEGAEISPAAQALPVEMLLPKPAEPSDADVIFTAARAVALEYGMTMGDAIHRLATVESWTQIETQGEVA